jgi:hypothetical protein
MILGSPIRRVALPRPQNHAVRGHIGKIANQFQISQLKRAAAAQITPRPRTAQRLGFLVFTACEHLRVFVGLHQNRAPQIAFRLGHESSAETVAFVFLVVPLSNF